jgi:anti-anti-sigma factor
MQVTTDTYFDLRLDYAGRRITIVGELDIATAPSLTTAVCALQRRSPGNITISLHDVTFIDASGLGAIATAAATQSARGEELTIVSVTDPARRAFALGRLTNLLPPN